MICLIDTNILLDVLQNRHPHNAAAAEVWDLVVRGAIEGHVSAISFNNIFYVARKSDGAVAATESLRKVRATFRVVPLDAGIIDNAVAANAKDFEDAIQ